MHELPVTESILEISLRHATAVSAKRITDIYLVIGQLASIVDDSVQFYWDIVSQNTAAEGAKLHFRRISTELVCLDCNIRYEPAPMDMSCPDCDGVNVKVVAGDDFYMESIEIED